MLDEGSGVTFAAVDSADAMSPARGGLSDDEGTNTDASAYSDHDGHYGDGEQQDEAIDVAIDLALQIALEDAPEQPNLMFSDNS